MRFWGFPKLKTDASEYAEKKRPEETKTIISYKSKNFKIKMNTMKTIRKTGNSKYFERKI